MEKKTKIAESELVLTDNNQAVYHLKLRPEQIARTIILVGDPGRVAEVSKRFDRIDHQVSNREFVSHTGWLNKQHISAVATGIGTDNIDIVLNELDALFNIDLQNRQIKQEHTSLRLIRIGTSGALQADLPVDKPVATATALGFDGVLHFYNNTAGVRELSLEKAFKEELNWPETFNNPYAVAGDKALRQLLANDMPMGITISAPGFYGPQGRTLRLGLARPELNEQLSRFSFNKQNITNYEMESSALYGLSAMLGHQALTVCCIIANRAAQRYSANYHKAVGSLIDTVLERLCSTSNQI